jgi:hypothetical protein
MCERIYIKMLNEGTMVYRPVPAYKIEDRIYKVHGFDIYDPEDEIWEFPPGTLVLVEEQKDDAKLYLSLLKNKDSSRLLFCPSRVTCIVCFSDVTTSHAGTLRKEMRES